jgi:hypothetical protein
MRTPPLLVLLPVLASSSLSGCSWLFVQPLPANYERGEPTNCTTSRAAPVVDTLLTLTNVGSAVYVAGQDNVTNKGTAVTAGLLVGALWFSSAIYGYSKTSDCAAAMEDDAPPPRYRRPVTRRPAARRATRRLRRLPPTAGARPSPSSRRPRRLRRRIPVARANSRTRTSRSLLRRRRRSDRRGRQRSRTRRASAGKRRGVREPDEDGRGSDDAARADRTHSHMLENYASDGRDRADSRVASRASWSTARESRRRCSPRSQDPRPRPGRQCPETRPKSASGRESLSLPFALALVPELLGRRADVPFDPRTAVSMGYLGS